MSMEFVTEEVEFEAKPRVYSGGNKGPRPRSEEQKKWDEQFKKSWESDRKTLAVQVPPDKADDARKRVNSSARFFKLTTTEGLPKPGKAENTVILTWLIREPKPRPNARKPRTKKLAEENAQ